MVPELRFQVRLIQWQEKPELLRSVKMEIQYIPGLSDFPMWIIRSWRSASVSRMRIRRPLLVSVSQSRCLILTIIIKGQGDSAHEVLQKSLCQREHDKKKKKVIAKLNKKKYPLNTYVIALIEEGENQLEFYSTLMFRQGSVIDDDIFVVGIAGGYDDALYLVEEIAKEVYEKTGDLDIRSYIREREREEA